MPRAKGKPGIRATNLSEKQKIFAVEYIKDLNGKRAALAAGANPKTASIVASKWLNSELYPEVAKEIGRVLAKRRLALEIDAARVVKELACIALFNPKNLLDPDGALVDLIDLPDEVAAAIKKLKITYGEEQEEVEDEDGNVHRRGTGQYINVMHVDIEFWDKMAALTMLAKHVGVLNEKAGGTNLNFVQINWDGLFNRPKADIEDAIEKRIEDAARMREERMLTHTSPSTDNLQRKEVIEIVPVVTPTQSSPQPIEREEGIITSDQLKEMGLFGPSNNTDRGE